MAQVDNSILLWLRYAKSPSDIAYATMMALQQVMSAYNNLDETNVGTPMSGDLVLAQNSLTGAALLKDYSTDLKKLKFLEWPLVTLVAPAQPISTTSSVDCGGFFVWDPNKYLGGSWYLEAALQVTSGGTATAQLKSGAQVVGSVSTTATSWTVARSSKLTMPTSQAALTVTLTSSGTSYTASLWTARLIYVP